jgi:ABC-type molybdate transport system substrate-binding protein
MQTAAVVTASPRRDAALHFLAFLTGDAGREILRRHHFTLP